MEIRVLMESMGACLEGLHAGFYGNSSWEVHLERLQTSRDRNLASSYSATGICAGEL